MRCSAATIYNDATDSQPISAIMDIVSDTDQVAFKVRIAMPNCSSEWWTPTAVSNISVSWMVVEKGGYKVNDAQIVVGSSEIDTQPTKIQWAFTFGSTCNNPTTQNDDDYMPGAIMTLQTNNNPHQLVFPRVTSSWHKSESNVCQYSWKYGHVFLKPPDNVTTDIQAETVGYMVFEMTNALQCIDGSHVLQVGSTYLTEAQSQIIYREQHSFASLGIFGLSISYNGGDLHVLRALKSSATQTLSVYLQEDQCEDEETGHRQEEVSYVLLSSVEYNCSGIEELTPTPAPTSPGTERPPRHDENKNDDSTGTALAVVLPILILGVVALVGFFAKSHFLNQKGFNEVLDESSTRSSASLV